MHERNPYARPPDFARLAAAHAELRPHCRLVANGRVHLDFTEDAAVRALTRALLAEDFKLDVDLPSGSLCPRVPQRLNYLLWIEDVIISSGLDADAVRGIDIGTGASCIYALLGARRFGWQFVATEVEQSSLDVARRNVERNHLEGSVEVVKTDKDGALIENVVTSSSTAFTFIMCNPPFFDGDGETGERFEKRGGREWDNGREGGGAGKRPLPRSGTVASANELATEGGEVAFVGRMIEESARLRQRVRFYTTMLGKKSSVATLSTRLARARDEEGGGGEGSRLRFASGELRQGRTQRWLLIWTYDEGVRLPTRPASLDLTTKELRSSEAMQWIRQQLHSLGVDIEEVEEEEEGQGRLLSCRATAPTWLRRKKKGKEDAPVAPSFQPLQFTVAPRPTSRDHAVTLAFAIVDDGRKRELSQLVIHLSNRLQNR